MIKFFRGDMERLSQPEDNGFAAAAPDRVSRHGTQKSTGGRPNGETGGYGRIVAERSAHQQQRFAGDGQSHVFQQQAEENADSAVILSNRQEWFPDFADLRFQLGFRGPLRHLLQRKQTAADSFSIVSGNDENLFLKMTENAVKAESPPVPPIRAFCMVPHLCVWDHTAITLIWK